MRRIILAIALVFCVSSARAADTLTPTPLFTSIINGTGCVGCRLFTYQAGTTTKQATYTDSSGNTPNTNPIVLDAYGNANVWLPSTSAYKYVLAPPGTDDPPTSSYWTVDNVVAGALSGLGIGSGLCASGGNLTVCNLVASNFSATSGTGNTFVLATSPTISSPTITGTLGGTGVIPNGALVNQGLTIGSSAVVLGGTYTTIAGLTLTGATLSSATLSSPTLTGTVSGPDIGSWTSTGMQLKALGVNETPPSAGNVNISGTYEIGGAQIAASNLSNGVTGSGAVVLATSATINTPLLNAPQGENMVSDAGTAYVCFDSGTSNITIHSTACVSSDERLKHDWKYDLPGLSAIEQLSPGTFDWLDVNSSKSRQVGLKAQDVQKIFPQIVTTDSVPREITLADGTKTTVRNVLSLDYGKLTLPLIVAVKEQQNEIRWLWAAIVLIILVNTGIIFYRKRA